MTRFRLRAVLPFVAAAAISCDRPPTLTSPDGAVDAAVIAQLQRVGYRGPALIAERTANDGRGARPMMRSLYLPENGHAALRRADARGAKASDAIRTALQVAATTPDQADPNHNSPLAQLGTVVAPSRLNGRNPMQHTVNFTMRFISYDFAKDEWYIVPGGEILESVIQARDSSAGHFHGSVDTMQLRIPIRVGRLVPATGIFSSSWATQWRVPEVSNEVNMRFRVREIGGPNDGETNWFYGLENDGVRVQGLVRIAANPSRYTLVGGTTTHPEAFNDWGTAGLVANIDAVAEAYYNATSRPATPTSPAVPGDLTRVNDMALFYGGRFDIGRTVNRVFTRCSDAATANCWQYSHYEHRLGTEVDINPESRGTPSRLTRFYRALSAEFPSVIVEGDHYHARTSASPYR